MRSVVRGVLAALMFSIVFAWASLAFAAPVAWQTVDVTLHDEKPTPIMLVSGTLPESAKLPAQVELAVPSGGQFQWAGEILGGPTSQDPEVKYTVTTRDGMDIYSFTLTKARTAQVEVVMPGAVQSDGTGYASAIKWVATQDVPAVNVSSRIPQAAQIAVPAEGAETVPGPTGYTYYQKSLKDVAAGDKVELSFAYTLPAAAAGAGAAGASGGSGDAIALVLVVAAFAVAFFIAARAISRKMKPSVAYEADDVDEPAATQAVEQHAFDVEADEPTPEPDTRRPARTSSKNAPTEAPAAGRKLDPRWLLAGVVVAALVIAGLVAGKSGTSAQLVDGTYQRHFGGTSVCTSAEIALAIPTDANPAKAADKVFASLEGQQGIGQVTIYVDRPRALVEFCESSNTEQAIRTAIEGSGYLDPAAPVAPSQGATAPADGQS